jgi:hypothetical protein
LKSADVADLYDGVIGCAFVARSRLVSVCYRLRFPKGPESRMAVSVRA